MADKLGTYRNKRDARRTPEPVPEEGPLPEGRDDTFVIQEHHARRLHWDFRLEHDGVLVSWALPKGVPDDPKTNHLAVHTEDHPLEYAAFAGEIGPRNVVKASHPPPRRAPLLRHSTLVALGVASQRHPLSVESRVF